ncbi:hypothetical protein BV378_37375 [Nostoc sp. RF31YmG]|nr:hypothetical protein BV378_37375 [Nostoc sp. RF31YmG]
MFISGEDLSDKYLYWWCYFAITWLILGMLLEILTDTRGRIHYAAEKGDIEKVRQLLDKGIDPNFRKMIHSATPIYYTATQGHREIVEILINYGADVNLGIEEDDAFNPLLAATINNSREVAELLISNGAELNILDTFMGQAPLHRAIEWGNLEIAELLILNGANINEISRSGESPLNIALSKYNNFIFNQIRRNFYEKIIYMLQKYGAIDYNYGD